MEALAERGVKREYVCIDTFTGFTSADVGFEYEMRGKAVGLYDDFFLINDPAWLKASISRFGYTNVTVRRADTTTFDYHDSVKSHSPWWMLIFTVLSEHHSSAFFQTWHRGA